jgi:glycosyltransferase involved in cell wall biosynthesis
MSIKLIQVTAAYKPAYIYGGPTMSVAKLCEALAKEDLEVEVLTSTANGKVELNVTTNQINTVDGVKVTYFKRLTKDHSHFSPALLKALRSKILKARGERDVLVHIHAWWNLISLLSCFVAKQLQVPVLLSPRGMLTTYTLGNRNAGFKSLIHRFIGKKLLNYCHIHATSEKEKQDIAQLINPKSITVIPNLVDLPQTIVPSPEMQSPWFRLLFLSRIEEKKGIELLFDSLKILDFDWKLQMAGSGDENYIKSLKIKAEHLGIADRISWLGHVKNENKFSLLAESELTVLTSYNENFANVVIESLSMGTAILVSTEVGLASYVAANELGWVTELRADAIATAIKSAYLDLDKRAKIRKISPDLIANNFNTATLVEKYITLYQTLSNG